MLASMFGSAGRFELPTVIHASEAGFFIAAKQERGAAMRTVVLDHTDLAIRVAESNQVFPEKTHAQRVAIGRRHFG
jgi:hypothetical protein